MYSISSFHTVYLLVRDTLANCYVFKTSEVSGFAAEMAIISSNYIFKGLAFETLGPWCKQRHRFHQCHRKPTYCGIRRFKIKEIPFREDFPCYSTWKRCKHSRHFSRFRIIIGNFCIVNQKCYVIMLSIQFIISLHLRVEMRKNMIVFWQ
jgi:hypothetical protein